MRVISTPLPTGAMLRRYQRGDHYTDCFAARVHGPVTRATFIEAFFTTRLFRLERRMLATALARPSTDAQARALALGESDRFAVWRYEGGDECQLLLADEWGLTRSWLMVARAPGDPPTERVQNEAARAPIDSILFFGSAVLATERRAGGTAARLAAAAARSTLWLHRAYSRQLLGAAARRVMRSTQAAG